MTTEKIKIRKSQNQLIVEIEAKKYWKKIVPSCLLLSIWFFGQYYLISTTIEIFLYAENNFPALILGFLIIGWALGAFYIIRTLIWQFYGVEVLTFTKNDFHISKKNGFLIFDKRFTINDQSHFVFDPSYSPEMPLYNRRKAADLMLGKGGCLQLQFANKKINFAHGLGIQEGESLLEQIEEWYERNDV